MARDTETEDDELDTGQETSEKPQSVRESIMAAREEVAEKNDDKELADDPDLHKRKSARKSDDDKEDKSPSKKKDRSPTEAVASDSETEDTEENTESKVEQTEEKPTVKAKPPVGWTKEAKAKWAELPPEIQESVLKREKEVSDGFAGTKQATERLNRLDAVINPRLQQIQAFGVTPEQTIDRLFQWMESLSHPNEGVRQQAFKILAENFRINLGAFAPQQQGEDTNQQQQTTQQTQSDAPPQWAQSLIERQQQVDNHIASQRQESASQFVTSWAKDKPHFEKVREEMFGLLQSGLQTGRINLPNGQLDHATLDAVYNKAVRTNDEVWEIIQEEKAEKEQAEAAEKARAIAVKKTADAAKARKAGSSLRPTAPTLSNLNGSKSKNSSSKHMSVRESILAAQAEINE